MKVVALDIETTGMSWEDDVLVVGAAKGYVGARPDTSSVILSGNDLFTQTTTIPAAWEWLHREIALADWIILHNASFDLPYLFKSGLLAPEEVKGRVFDTLVMAAATGSHDSVGLAQLCKEYGINGGPDWLGMKSQRGKLTNFPMSEVASYCEQDCAATLRLFAKIKPLADTLYDRQFIAYEGDFCALLAKMRVKGLPLNLPFVAQRRKANVARKAEIQRDILTPNKISSPYARLDLLNWLRSHKWKPTDATSLDEDAIMGFAGQSNEQDKVVLLAVLEARALEKEDSTYLTGFLEHADANGCVHPNFFSGGTRTWRLSSNHPNAQNIPREMQDDLFTASQPGGALISLDYSQAQLRLAAMYAQEHEMARLFALPDTDIHTATAVALFGPEEGPKHRREGKGANFAVIFGAGAAKVAASYNLDFATAENVLREHHRRFPRLQQAARETIRRWEERGYIILPYGKRTWRKPSDASGQFFAGWNYLIQGAEGTIIQKAMMDMDAAGLDVRSQVHDKLYIDVPPGIDPQEVGREAARIMAGAVPEKLARRTVPPIAMTTDLHITRREG